MSLGNQRARPNNQSNTTNVPLVSPITPEELAFYLGLEYDSSESDSLNMHLLAACGWYVAHMNNELLSREWVLKFDRYPSQGNSFTGLGAINANLKSWIDIPIYPVSSVEGITADGDTVAFTSDLDNKPPRIFLDSYDQDIIINYTAGYASPADIPKSTMLGLTMMAAYLYEHRGACDIGNAAKESGAANLWGYNAMILSL